MTKIIIDKDYTWEDISNLERDMEKLAENEEGDYHVLITFKPYKQTEE